MEGGIAVVVGEVEAGHGGGIAACGGGGRVERLLGGAYSLGDRHGAGEEAAAGNAVMVWSVWGWLLEALLGKSVNAAGAVLQGSAFTWHRAIHVHGSLHFREHHSCASQ